MSTLVIILDDYGKDYCQPYFEAGWIAEPRQPTLMQLTLTGLTFTEFYSAPSCSQSRVAVETGRIGYRTGVSRVVTPGDSDGRLDARERRFQLANMLKRHRPGTRCAYFGKDHQYDEAVGGKYGPLAAGYDKWAGQRGNIGVPLGNGTDHGDYLYYNYPHNVVPTAAAEENPNTTTYTGVKTTQDAAAWINDAANIGKQWLTICAFSLPHAPYEPTPPAGDHTYDTDPEFGMTDAGAPPTGVIPEADDFLALVEAVDTYIGRMLVSIQAGGNFSFANDTVIFLGDNGTPDTWTGDPFNPDHGKQTVYRHGTCVPLIVAGKGVIDAGRRTNALVTIMDLYTTILDLNGVDALTDRPLGMPVDGISFRDVLESPTSVGRRKWAYRERYDDFEGPQAGYQRSITDGICDLVIDFLGGTGEEEFYDNTSDESQMTNLIATSTSRATMTERQRQSLGNLRNRLRIIEADHDLERASTTMDPTVM